MYIYIYIYKCLTWWKNITHYSDILYLFILILCYFCAKAIVIGDEKDKLVDSQRSGSYGIKTQTSLSNYSRILKPKLCHSAIFVRKRAQGYVLSKAIVQLCTLEGCGSLLSSSSFFFKYFLSYLHDLVGPPWFYTPTPAYVRRDF